MENQLVTCGGMDCSVCSVLSTANAVFRYLLDISAALAILLLVTAGFLYLLGRGSEEKLDQARRVLFYALYGFLVTAISFIIVATTFFVTASENRGEWFRISCAVVHETDSNAQEPANIENSSYLENKEDRIVESGSIGSIVSGDKKIIKLDSSKIDPDSFEADIWSLDPERKISFFSSDKDVSGQEVIDFRNVELGFNQNQAENDYKIQPTDEYTADQVVDPKDKIKPIFSVTTSDAEDSFRVEWGEDLRKINGNSAAVDKKGLADFTENLREVTQTAKLGGKEIFAFTSGKPSLVDKKHDNCANSGGEMKEFRNPCLVDKENYDNRNIQCSNVYEPVTACDCPIGYYLKNEKCYIPDEIIKIESGKERNLKDKGQDCQSVSLEQKKCPASRCEGEQMMYYPDSVKNQCLDTLKGPQIIEKYCEGAPSKDSAENKKCADEFSKKSDEEKMKEAEDFFKKNGTSPDWYYKLLEDKYGNEPDYATNGSSKTNTGGTGSTGTVPPGRSTGTVPPGNLTGGASSTGGTNTGTGGRTPTGTGPGQTGPSSTGTGPTDTGTGPTDNGKSRDTGSKTTNDGTLPQDQGSGNFNPTPTYKELKECIGLKDDQIPYNGILVVLLNPSDPLNRRRSPNGDIAPSNSRMYYLSRRGEIIGKNGVDLGQNPVLGGQEYGARTFDKGATGRSMWGRGWKIFKGTRIYCKQDGSWCDQFSFGSQHGYKTGTSDNPMSVNNLRGGAVTETDHCGQHSTESSAGCATFGKGKSHEGFVKKAKSDMTMTNGTIMQVNLVGQMDTASGKFSSPDCGYIDYCAAKRTFDNSRAREFRNDPNQGYDPNKEDERKRMVQC